MFFSQYWFKSYELLCSSRAMNKLLFTSDRASTSRKAKTVPKFRLMNNGNLSTLSRLIVEVWVTQGSCFTERPIPVCVSTVTDTLLELRAWFTCCSESQDLLFLEIVAYITRGQSLCILEISGASRYWWVLLSGP